MKRNGTEIRPVRSFTAGSKEEWYWDQEAINRESHSGLTNLVQLLFDDCILNKKGDIIIQPHFPFRVFRPFPIF